MTETLFHMMQDDTPGANALEHKRILASAGSGKTYQLVTRYLSLIDRGVDPRKILASTFTRLAAGEIRDNVIERLISAAESDREREYLSEMIGADLTRPDVDRMLRTVAGSMHTLSIRTLDAFFASIVQSFALEFGIAPGGRIMPEEETEELRLRAIEQLLDERDPQRLIEIMRRLTRGDSKRSIITAVDDAVTELYTLSLEADDEAWNVMPCIDGELGPVELVEAIDALASVGSIRLPTHKDARDKDVEQVRAHDWEAFLTDGIARKLAAGEAKYRSGAIDPHVSDAYQPVLRHACALIVNRFVESNLAARDLVTRYRGFYDDLKREHNIITFTDLAHVLDGTVDVQLLSDIWYRIDAEVEHVLLDEFQDTSAVQWRAIQPLLKEIASHEPGERTFFCVGDVKQSIYGWRDASPDILNELPGLLFGEGGDESIETQSMPISRRSGPAVIDTVNRVFMGVDENHAIQDYHQVAAHWQSGFEAHRVWEKEHAGLPGEVVLETINSAEDDDSRYCRLKAVVDRVREMYRRAPGLTIGILTRTRAVAGQLLAMLQNSKVPAGSAGGGALTDAGVVNTVLDLLQLAGSPDDTAAAFHVAMSPLADIVNFHEPDNRWARYDFSRDLRTRLLERGCNRYLSELAPPLMPLLNAREARRYLRLIELAETFDATGSHDSRAFVRYVDQTNVSDTRQTAIQVMTIHAAKGLQFDAVILPELDWSLDGERGFRVLYERDGPTGSITTLCRYITSSLHDCINGAGFDIESLCRNNKDRTVRDTLCLLYVAMTRARQSLYMMIDAPKLTSNGAPHKRQLTTPAGLLWHALGNGETPGPEQIIYQHGSEDWLENVIAPAPEPPEPQAPIRLNFARRERVSRRAFSAVAPSVQAVRLIRSIDDREATDRGSAVHQLFEKIEWIEDFDMNDDDLVGVLATHFARRGDEWRRDRVREFRASLDKSEIRALLSREGKPLGARIEREIPFIRLVDGRLQRGAIDRLEIVRNAEGATSAMIIDFKTDAVSDDKQSIAAIVESYRPQLGEYKAAIAEQFAIDPAHITCTLALLTIGRVVEL